MAASPLAAVDGALDMPEISVGKCQAGGFQMASTSFEPIFFRRVETTSMIVVCWVACSRVFWLIAFLVLSICVVLFVDYWLNGINWQHA